MRTHVLERLQLVTRLQASTAQAQALAFAANCTLETYRDYLLRAYGFEAPLESACVMTPDLASHNATNRPRTRYIAHDLAELGVSLERLLEVRTCPLPPFRDVSRALGWLYAAERNVLTNNLCHRQLAARDPDLAAKASYLNCYGTASSARWRAFGLALERAAENADADRIAEAAVESYERMRRWLLPQA